MSSPNNEPAKKAMVLPSAVTGHSELARLIREAESVAQDLEAGKLRGQDIDMAGGLSSEMRDLLELNNLKLASPGQADKLKHDLSVVAKKAPVVHMTFATEIDQKALEQLVDWLRKETDPHVLASTGLQPSLVGGVYLRTPNKVHDFTLKAMLASQRDVLTNELEALLNEA